MIPANHFQALRLVTEIIGDASVEWAVTGSFGMAAQGAPVEVHDLDIQTDPEGAYRLGDLLARYAVTPVRYVASEQIRSHLGKYQLLGVEVEIMGGVEKCVAGVWEQPVDVRKHRRWVELNGLPVPVLDLRYELEAYTKMGRDDKAKRLRAWLAAQA